MHHNFDIIQWSLWGSFLTRLYRTFREKVRIAHQEDGHAKNWRRSKQSWDVPRCWFLDDLNPHYQTSLFWVAQVIFCRTSFFAKFEFSRLFLNSYWWLLHSLDSSYFISVVFLQFWFIFFDLICSYSIKLSMLNSKRLFRCINEIEP